MLYLPPLQPRQTAQKQRTHFRPWSPHQSLHRIGCGLLGHYIRCSVSAFCTISAWAAPTGDTIPASTTTSHAPHWKHSVRHIPKPARSACARSLCDRLEAVVSRPNNPNNWREVLDFGFEILHYPPRGGKRHNIMSTILKRLRGAPGSDDREQVPRNASRKVPPEALRAAAVTAKLEEGNVIAAVRIL